MERMKRYNTVWKRMGFNEIWPRELGYINRNVGKKQMGDIIWRCYQTVGKERTCLLYTSDTSLRVPSGCTGIVMDVRISSTGSGHHRGDLVVDSAEKKKQFKNCLLYTSRCV